MVDGDGLVELEQEREREEEVQDFGFSHWEQTGSTFFPGPKRFPPLKTDRQGFPVDD